jgi:hypothetical protein
MQDAAATCVVQGCVYTTSSEFQPQTSQGFRPARKCVAPAVIECAGAALEWFILLQALAWCCAVARPVTQLVAGPARQRVVCRGTLFVY